MMYEYFESVDLIKIISWFLIGFGLVGFLVIGGRWVFANPNRRSVAGIAVVFAVTPIAIGWLDKKDASLNAGIQVSVALLSILVLILCIFSLEQK